MNNPKLKSFFSNNLYLMLLNSFANDELNSLGNVIKYVWLNSRWKSTTIDNTKKEENKFKTKNKPFEISDKIINENIDLIYDFFIEMITLKPSLKIITKMIYLFDNDSFKIPISYLNRKGLYFFMAITKFKNEIFNKRMYPNFQNIYTDSNLLLTEVPFNIRYNICIETNIIFYEYCLSHATGKKEIRKNLSLYRSVLIHIKKDISNDPYRILGLYRSEKQKIKFMMNIFIDHLNNLLK